ncbi:MAG: ParA family protein [Raoultibacter sp.]
MQSDSKSEHVEPCANSLFPLAPITIIAGHYGVGKTNFSLNLAIDAAECGQNVVLVDLDVVNPYFRSSDYTSLLEEGGVRVVAPIFAGLTLDSPSISGAVATVIEDAIRQGAQANSSANSAAKTCVIIDAGGDDVGATALGRFAPRLNEGGYDMLYVINRYRNLTQTPEEAVQVLAEIEEKARVKATGVVNNSHLKHDTDEDTILEALPFANETARQLGLPLVCTAVPNGIVNRKSTLFSKSEGLQNVYPVQVYVRTPWGS